MTRALIVSGLLITVAGCRHRVAPAYREIANSEAVKLLRVDETPYRIIYNPPVDLTKKPAAAATPATSGPASPRRE
jgi:hypothetical protein